MDMSIDRELTWARGLTRGKRKLSVTPLRCRDRWLVHRPYGSDSLEGETKSWKTRSFLTNKWPTIVPERRSTISGFCGRDDMIGVPSIERNGSAKLDRSKMLSGALFGPPGYSS